MRGREWKRREEKEEKLPCGGRMDEQRGGRREDERRSREDRTEEKRNGEERGDSCDLGILVLETGCFGH